MSKAAPMETRFATEADIPAMAGVINGWIDATDWFPRIHSAEVIEGFIREALPCREIWVIGDPVAGYLSFDPEVGKVSALYTSRPGEGLGKALVDRVKVGRYRLFLHTHVPKAGARRFYAREGFVEVARVAAEQPETVPELRMEWVR